MGDDIYTNLHSEPTNEQIVMIKRWQLSVCDNNHCAAALLNFFIADTEETKRYTEKELCNFILNLFGVVTVRKAVKLLQNKGIITIHNNPDPKFKFDKTNYYVLQKDVVNMYLQAYNKRLERGN